jgi:DNA-binding NarL/FixJ family response regulator
MVDASRVAPVRILLVDDHSIMREGLSKLLGDDANATIVGSVATGEDAVLAAHDLQPDLIIMDLVLPTLSGIDATRQIISELPHTQVIVFSARYTSQLVHRALRAGARGYVAKAGASADLLSAIAAVSGGRQYLSPVIAALFDQELFEESPPQSAFDRISARERDVLRHIVTGATSSEIAKHMSLSRKTVDAYRSRLMVKLGVANRSELVRLALAYDLPAA